MGILTKMLDTNVREEYLDYKRNALGYDPEFLEQFEAYLKSEECMDDISRMINGEYFFNPPNKVLLKKKYSDKKRAVFQYELKNKFLLMLMGHVLHEYDHIFSDSLYSFRRNRTASSLINKIKSMKDINSRWALKTDFRHYGESVDVKILISQLEKIFADDPEFMNFSRQLLLDKKYIWRGVLQDHEYCLKTGNPLTNFFENVYAMQVDELMSNISTLYGRYGDDIVAFFNSEEEAKRGKDILEDEISKLGLSFNEAKTYIVGPDEPLEVLGVKVTQREVDVADSSLDKIRYRYGKKAKKILIRKRKRKFSDEWAMTRLINFINRRFFYLTEDNHELNWCRWAFPVITRIDSLKAIDHIFQEYIRYVGSGKKSKSRFRVRYKQMQKLGYHSLVHYYYHREKFFENPFVSGVTAT